jgi:hypothetical protein
MADLISCTPHDKNRKDWTLKEFKDKSPSGEEVYKRFKSDLRKSLRALRVSRIMELCLATIE